MLVLSRKVGERIYVGDQVKITVVRITGGGVRLGIEAPSDLPVVREELMIGKGPDDLTGQKPVAGQKKLNAQKKPTGQKKAKNSSDSVRS